MVAAIQEPSAPLGGDGLADSRQFGILQQPSTVYDALQRSKVARLHWSVDRQTVAVLGEGTMFYGQQEHLSGDFAELKRQSNVVKEMGGVQKREILTLGPASTVLTIE